MRKTTAILVVIILTVMNILPVYAMTLELMQQKENKVNGNIYQITYYSPDSTNNIPMIISKTESWGTVKSYRLAFYNENTTWTYSTVYKTWQASGTFYYKEFATLPEAIEALFNNQTATDYTTATQFGNFEYGAVIVYSQEQYSAEAASNLEAAFYDWYLETYNTEPPLAGNIPDEPEEAPDGFFEEILYQLKKIVEIITGGPDVEFLETIKETMQEELEGNEFIGGIYGIGNTLHEIFATDYDRPADFYASNPFNITIDGIPMKYQEDDYYSGYWLDNRFNMELNLFQDWNMRWYFGDYPTMHGAYILVNGKPAGKAIIDPIISAILWIGFGIGLWKNITRIIEGDFASVGKIAIEKYGKSKEDDKKKGAGEE